DAGGALRPGDPEAPVRPHRPGQCTEPSIEGAGPRLEDDDDVGTLAGPPPELHARRQAVELVLEAIGRAEQGHGVALADPQLLGQWGPGVARRHFPRSRLYGNAGLLGRVRGTPSTSTAAWPTSPRRIHSCSAASTGRVSSGSSVPWNSDDPPGAGRTSIQHGASVALMSTLKWSLPTP